MPEFDIECLGKGAEHTIDDRDFRMGENIEFGARPIDWSTAVDQEETITVKDQGRSWSCVGQSQSSMLERNEHTMQRSARYVYCQIALPNQQGAYMRDGMTIGARQTVSPESDFLSYPANEDLLTNRFGLPLKYRTKPLMYALVPCNVEAIASAIRDHGSVMIGVRGSNAGWHQADVAFTGNDWGHAVMGIRAVMRNGKKTIKFLNSWSKAWGSKGFGYFDETYLTRGGMAAYIFTTQEVVKPVPYELKNKKIAEASPIAKANSNFVNACYRERYSRDATKTELALFVGRMVKDAANLILGAWRSPFFGN